MSKVCENAAFAGMGDERWRMECGDRPVGKGRRVAHVGQGEVGRGRGVVHLGQGRRGTGGGGVVRARWVIGIAMVRMGSGRVENARNVGSSLDATISVRGKSQDGDIGEISGSQVRSRYRRFQPTIRAFHVSSWTTRVVKMPWASAWPGHTFDMNRSRALLLSP